MIQEYKNKSSSSWWKIHKETFLLEEQRERINKAKVKVLFLNVWAEQIVRYSE